MSAKNKITAAQLNALRLIAEAGAKSATIALKQMFGANVRTGAPRIELVTKSQLKARCRGKGALTAVFFRVSGALDSTIIDIFTRENVLKLIDILLGKPAGTTLFVGEMGQSAVKEASNILSSSYLTAIGKAINAPLNMSTPSLAFNLESAVDDYTIFGAENVSHALVIDTEFRVERISAAGTILVLLDEASVSKLVKSL